MYNDYELLYLAQENNEDAVNELRKKYNSCLLYTSDYSILIMLIHYSFS